MRFNKPFLFENNVWITCAYAPYAPNWLNTKGFSKFMWPAICCMRRNCRSLSVSANLTTKLEDAPCLNAARKAIALKGKNEKEKRKKLNEMKSHERTQLEKIMDNASSKKCFAWFFLFLVWVKKKSIFLYLPLFMIECSHAFKQLCESEFHVH